MKNSISVWRHQSKPFNTDLNEALHQQHHATQFLALVGRYLIPQKDDDSNTNMEFIPEENLLLGNALPDGMRVALQLVELKLFILDKRNNIRKTIQLVGKTKQQVFVELSQNLADVGVDVTKLKNELHYEIPAHPLDEGTGFSVKNQSAFLENTNYRNNAKMLLNEVSKIFQQDEAIRIWPHHFDTGAFYVISKNDKGEMTQTIGIGFAIPDGMIDEPYYYLSFWSADAAKGLDKLPTLPAGKWLMPDWNGAVLTHSEIIKAASAEVQHKLVKSFYKSGIEMLMNHFK